MIERPWMRRVGCLTVVVCCLACGAENTPDRSSEFSATASVDAQGQFWANLTALCSNAFGGVAVQFPEADDWLEGAELVMHVRECSDQVIRVPFHVGDDRSRTWVLTRHDDAIELRHDHRHEDGSPGDPTMYGAITLAEGAADLQEFPRETAEGAAGGWRIELVPGERFTYGTVRDGAWRHRLDFDLTREVPAPPAPWGHGEPAAEPG